MEDIIHAILHLNDEIEEIKRQVEILQKRHDVFFKEDWMDGQDVMQALSISRRTLQTLRSSGILTPTQLRAKFYYRVSDIKTLLQKNYIRNHLTKKP